MSALAEVIHLLHTNHREIDAPYWIPGLWIDFQTTRPQNLNPYQFYIERLEAIQRSNKQPLIEGELHGGWTRNAITYNLFPRVTTAFNHTEEPELKAGVNRIGWRNTGSLLKCIALLPYIHSMGFNTVHLLPITAVGQDGKKGTLGSPYGIRNPYRLDENLNEPAAVEDVELLFRAFVEAAHQLGIRVVMEFVLRTASKDSDLVKEHPSWFYWIREDIPDRPANSKDTTKFGSPLWSPEKMGELYWKVNSGQFHDLVPPSETYRQMYTDPPHPDHVHMENGHWIGVLSDGTRVRIPGAFTDWPPESSQAPWTDVTYLRLFDHPQFNYMAYNTLRMYDSRLAREENIVHDLWDTIVGIIPHYQHTCGIDGVMIDMGHSLPHDLMQKVIRTARQINPDFAFWSEDFSISHQSREMGYNAVMGYLIFDMHQPENMQKFVDRLSYHSPENIFFITPENHNTPRAATRSNALGFCHQVLLYMVALPGMPFMSSGFELYEEHPINTGLNFTPEQVAKYPPEKLPLFSEWAYNWTRNGNMVGAARYANHLRKTYMDLLANPNPSTILPGSSDNPNIFVFLRHNENHTLVFVFNMTMYDWQNGNAEIYARDSVAHGRWGFEGATRLSERLSIHVELSGGHSTMFEIKDTFSR